MQPACCLTGVVHVLLQLDLILTRLQQSALHLDQLREVLLRSTFPAQSMRQAHHSVSQDSKKIKSEVPYFELLTTELVATEERVLNVSRFLPAIRFAFVTG